ncbi:sodium/hydrogen exchanger family protein [Pseudomonas fluorescens]|uniref:Sodium/hydrogen exchanger family protein n=1 Tax=Pseudomonas fluorescens TaxID=294 RepID=A0A0P8WEC9_PSEFL|nr:sodium/hydrogen exchanger family protein [Pseudomonas fluorescens]
MQTAYTVLIMLMLVGVSRLIGRVIPLPLPLVQIAAGALIAWPTLGLHVALDPELFLFLFLPPLLFSDGWRKTAEAAIHALEAEEVNPQDAAQSALAAELKARIMSEYRHQLEVFDDSAEAQALAFQMALLERRLRLKALRAQRLELYSLSRQHQIGDDVLREVLGELDLSEANLGQVK